MLVQNSWEYNIKKKYQEENSCLVSRKIYQNLSSIDLSILHQFSYNNNLLLSTFKTEIDLLFHQLFNLLCGIFVFGCFVQVKMV